MSELPSPVLRALAGLDEGCGRTLVIAGPSFSGKSALLEKVRSHLEREGTFVVNLKGIYRDRETPFAAALRLRSVGDPPEMTGLESTPGEAPSAGPVEEPIPYIPEEAATQPRRRGGERRRGVVLGRTYVTPARRSEIKDPGEYWNSLIRGLGEQYRNAAILVEDAALVDQESRGFLLALTERNRFRPVLLAFALDSQIGGFSDWEERLVGRADVDWVRFDRPQPDQRERPRVEEAIEALPEAARRAVGFLALMRGTVPAVTLGRVLGTSGAALRTTFEPGITGGVVKHEEGIVSLTHADWSEFIAELIPEETRREMHHQIALAMQALTTEPNLQRRAEIAQHFFQWEHGVAAFRALLDAEAVAERLDAFDMADDLLGSAIACVHGLPSGERAEAFADLKVNEARVLISAGRPRDAAKSLAEGMTFALRAGVAETRLEEMVEGILPILRGTGPRKEFLTEVRDLSERCHDARAHTCEVLLLALLGEYEVMHHRMDRAQAEARRAVHVARALAPGPAQAVAMVAMAASHVEGTDEQRAVAEKFVKAAQGLLTHSRRYALQQQAEALAIRLKEVGGEFGAALQSHDRAIAVAQRLGTLPIELDHQLAIARILFDEQKEGDAPALRTKTTLRRAGEIVGLLHLLPPSPGLLDLWLAEGRLEVGLGHPDAARERWQALMDLPTGQGLSRVSGEATARLALLEDAEGRESEARRYSDLFWERESSAGLSAELMVRIDGLRMRLAAPPSATAEDASGSVVPEAPAVGPEATPAAPSGDAPADPSQEGPPQTLDSDQPKDGNSDG